MVGESSNSNIIEILKQYSAGKRHFSQVNLEKANLAEMFLREINFSSSVLDYVILEQADLSNSFFHASSLVKTILSGANLQGADLAEADLTGADLTRANLTGANLTHVNLEGADFTEADLTGANLTGANLTGANLTGANFAYANLSNANLSLSKLIETNIVNTSQANNSLEITKLDKVNFQEANLAGAFFMGVDLSLAQLEGAFFDDKTKFMRGFDPIKAGLVNTKKIKAIALDKLFAQFNYLLNNSNRLLGSTITTKYFNSSRPDYSWLNQFQINSQNQIYSVETISAFVSLEQLDYFQQWIDAFTQSCSKIIRNFPEAD